MPVQPLYGYWAPKKIGKINEINGGNKNVV
jgi:hypothetical protein